MSERQRLAARYDMWLPGNQRKLEAAEELAQLADEVGISLIEMAIAFVIRHPVTAAIIGPRTTEHLESQLTAADVELSADVLDHIDEINPPGVTINHADNGWTTPALQPAARRRYPEKQASTGGSFTWRSHEAASTPPKAPRSGSPATST